MALENKRYSRIHAKTGSDLTRMETRFNNNEHAGLDAFPAESSLMYQMQKMQEELDYLRTEISTNKDKATFPGFGTSSSTALRGNTTTISSSQASAILLNTAKVSQNLRTANHTLQFDVINSRGSYTLRITVVDSSGRSPVTKTADISLS